MSKPRKKKKKNLGASRNSRKARTFFPVSLRNSEKIQRQNTSKEKIFAELFSCRLERDEESLARGLLERESETV